MFERLRINGSSYYLDGVLTLVDAPRTLAAATENKRHEAMLTAIKPMQRRQIAMGDVLVLSKCDLMDSDDSIYAIEMALRHINPLANFIRCSNGVIKVSSVLRLHAFDSRTCATRLQSTSKGVHATHMSDVMAMSLRINNLNAATTTKKIHKWIQWLVKTHRGRLLRVKGILKIQGMPRQLVIQGIDDDIRAGVGELWGATPSHLPGVDLQKLVQSRGQLSNNKQSVVVVIGHGLDREELQKSFEELFCVHQ